MKRLAIVLVVIVVIVVIFAWPTGRPSQHPAVQSDTQNELKQTAQASDQDTGQMDNFYYECQDYMDREFKPHRYDRDAIYNEDGHFARYSIHPTTYLVSELYLGVLGYYHGGVSGDNLCEAMDKIPASERIEMVSEIINRFDTSNLPYGETRGLDDRQIRANLDWGSFPT